MKAAAFQYGYGVASFELPTGLAGEAGEGELLGASAPGTAAQGNPSVPSESIGPGQGHTCNVAIDLAKSLATFGVVVLHFFGPQAGVVKAVLYLLVALAILVFIMGSDWLVLNIDPVTWHHAVGWAVGLLALYGATAHGGLGSWRAARIITRIAGTEPGVYDLQIPMQAIRRHFCQLGDPMVNLALDSAAYVALLGLSLALGKIPGLRVQVRVPRLTPRGGSTT